MFSALGKFPEARRRLSVLESLPNIDWYAFREFEANSQFAQNIMRNYMNGDTRVISQEITKDLDRLEQDEKFSAWRAELKEWQAKVKRQ